MRLRMGAFVEVRPCPDCGTFHEVTSEVEPFFDGDCAGCWRWPWREPEQLTFREVSGNDD